MHRSGPPPQRAAINRPTTRDLPPTVSTWTTNDVVEWLRRNSLDMYESLFRQVHATGELLLGLSGDVLTHMGITSLKQRKELLKAVSELHDAAASSRREINQSQSPRALQPGSDRKVKASSMLHPEEDFDEVKSHESFLEALNNWRGSKPHDVATETAKVAPQVCYQCFRQANDGSHHDGHVFCTPCCVNLYKEEHEREKLAVKAIQSTVNLTRQLHRDIWSLDIKL